jgi:RimJ/RimL family protein N-acetyltransferase
VSTTSGIRIDIGNWHLRAYRDDDLPALLKYADNPNVVRNLRDRFPHPYTSEAGRAWIAVAKEQNPVVSFVIASEQELVGGAGIDLQTDVYRRSGELGYWLAEPFWGRGITTAAARALVEYAFTQLDLVRVFAGVFATNPASARVLEKVGFQFEGRAQRAVFKHGALIDELRYAILRPAAK